MENRKKKITLTSVRAEAKRKMKGYCGIFKVCDGDLNRICQNNHYGGSLNFGGAGLGKSFQNNYLALEKIKLNMRLIQNSFEPELKYSFFGNELLMPIMGGSTAGVNSFGGESVISEDNFCNAVVEGCKLAGSIGWRGDSYTYTPEKSYGLNSIQRHNGWGVKIIKPRVQYIIKEFITKAQKIGINAIGVDIDGCGSYMMHKYQQPVEHKSKEDLVDLIESTDLPFIIKGIMTITDAKLALESGASAIVVSNHGGRVMDCTPGTAEVLPRIAKIIDKNIPIFVDGGIRTGYDVLKMLALGADAVLIGRDIIRTAVGGGSLGVRLHMEHLRKTLRKAMLMTGCKTLDDIDQTVIYSEKS
jgi:4-hydroxymandelate oxidase